MSQQSKNTQPSAATGSTAPKPRPPLLSNDSADVLIRSGLLHKQAYVDLPQEKIDTSERLESLRVEMAKHQLDS